MILQTVLDLFHGLGGEVAEAGMRRIRSSRSSASRWRPGCILSRCEYRGRSRRRWGDGHLVVIQDDQEIGAEVAGLVETFDRPIRP